MNLVPVIRKIIETAEASGSPQDYFVLLILMSGKIADYYETEKVGTYINFL